MGGIVLNLDGQAQPRGQLLKILFDDVITTAITATPITANDDFFRCRILLFELAIPPVRQIIPHKLRRIFTRPDAQIRGVAFFIINAVRNGNADGKTGKVVIIDGLVLFHVHLPLPIQFADKFFFFVSMLNRGFGLSFSSSPTAAIFSN